MHYNYYRTYNPQTGRYMQSDPLGLAAGANTYNYVGNNPLNGIDPLGLVQLDKNNKVGYNIIEKSIYPFGTNKNVFNVEAMRILIYANDGISIEALKRIGSNLPNTDFTADCHGWTFGYGQVWINNDKVASLLEHDNYKEISRKEIKDGNIVIYYNHNDIEHSLTLFKTSQGMEAYGKGGYQPYPYLQEIDKGWKKHSDTDEITMKFFRKTIK